MPIACFSIETDALLYSATTDNKQRMFFSELVKNKRYLWDKKECSINHDAFIAVAPLVKTKKTTAPMEDVHFLAPSTLIDLFKNASKRDLKAQNSSDSYRFAMQTYIDVHKRKRNIKPEDDLTVY